jgi:glycosyltransferase involved in cell wall biosynthesis
MVSKKKKVCIFGSQVTSALQGNTIGGAELQMAMLATTLAEQDIEVVVVDREAENSFSLQKNIRIEAVADWNKGIRGLRFFTHRLPRLIKSLRSTDASVFYVRGVSYLFLAPLYVAKKTNSTFVLAISHDSELWRFKERNKVFYKNNSSLWDWISTNLPNELAAYFLVRYADVLLVQHDEQADRAKELGKPAVLLPNMIDRKVLKVDTTRPRQNIVIVGALSNRKGLDVLLPVIRKLEHVTFEFVGEAEDIEGMRIKDELQKCRNVILNGWMDRAQTLEKIATAKALLNTSKMEGFPNAFIEAWALRTPVISLSVDPGGVIRKNNLGFACDGDIGMVERLLNGASLHVDTERIQNHVYSYHSAEYTLNVFNKILS